VLIWDCKYNASKSFLQDFTHTTKIAQASWSPPASRKQLRLIIRRACVYVRQDLQLHAWLHRGRRYSRRIHVNGYRLKLSRLYTPVCNAESHRPNNMLHLSPPPPPPSRPTISFWKCKATFHASDTVSNQWSHFLMLCAAQSNRIKRLPPPPPNPTFATPDDHLTRTRVVKKLFECVNKWSQRLLYTCEYEL
jgi:hypothetical protein